MRARARVCVCVCVCEKERESVCVCVCVHGWVSGCGRADFSSGEGFTSMCCLKVPSLIEFWFCVLFAMHRHRKWFHFQWVHSVWARLFSPGLFFLCRKQITRILWAERTLRGQTKIGDTLLSVSVSCVVDVAVHLVFICPAVTVMVDQLPVTCPDINVTVDQLPVTCVVFVWPDRVRTVFEGLWKFRKNGISFSRPCKSVKTEWGLWKFVNFVVFRVLEKNCQLVSHKLHFLRQNSS